MAAHALLPFIHLNEYQQEVEQTLTDLDLDNLPNNMIHGLLLKEQLLI